MRTAGILLPITALPSPYGVGSMGQAARDFIDFLHAGGQSCWQILPICPTSYGDSPYQSFSSYAGNPYFIDLDDLCRDSLLCPVEYQAVDWGGDPGRVDYDLLYQRRFSVLRCAVKRLRQRYPRELARFCRAQAAWLPDYALFMALKERFGGAAWQTWPEAIRRRAPEALAAARTELSGEICFWMGVQCLFFRQWEELKAYAGSRNISMIGDLPIYVALDSVDVWANPEQFQLDDDLKPVEVAGCPPDAFTADGQLWGNPLFNWNRLRSDGYRWWLDRVAHQLSIYDILRIDHFRGFDEYYAIPAGEPTARNGRWRPGPGLEFFQTLNRALNQPAIIAEDLGFLTPSVEKLLSDTGYPGMKVLEFAFDADGGDSRYLPHHYPRRCVAYTGTHDNDTAIGWFTSAPQASAEMAVQYLQLTEQEGYHWGMMRGIWSSVAELAIVQMQDLLGIGSEGRMNTPSTLGGNWSWRCPEGAFTQELAQRLYRSMWLYGRLPEFQN